MLSHVVLELEIHPIQVEFIFKLFCSLVNESTTESREYFLVQRDVTLSLAVDMVLNVTLHATAGVVKVKSVRLGHWGNSCCVEQVMLASEVAEF
jgi:hypothetical protein